jgi:AraC-like DNA-binding protein
MAYVEYPILPELRTFVKVIWSMENDPGEIPEFSMRILPDSCVEMVIHYARPLATTFSDGRKEVQPISFVVTQMKSFIELSPTGSFGFMSIRFSAQGAYHFFSVPMKELTDGVVDLGNVWKSFADDLTDRIQTASNGSDRSLIIQQALMLQLYKNGQFDKAVDYSIDALYRTNGQLSIEQLAVQTGLSNRQLIRRFDQKVGMSPKEFATIIRFIHATKLLRDQSKSVYDVSYSSGYYDHAHFFHDFRRFSGLSPGEFRERSDVFL